MWEAGQMPAAKRNSSVITGLVIKIGFKAAASHGAQTVHDHICRRIDCCIVRLAHGTRMGGYKIDRATLKDFLWNFSDSS